MSVVVPTRGRPEALRRSLRAVLVAAERAGRPFEVVVVDDGPDAQTREVVETAGRGHGQRLRYVSASAHGASGPGEARNVGIAHARGEIVAFTDDDTQCDPEWLQRALERLDARPEAAGVEGAVLPERDARVPWQRARVVRGAPGGYLTANLVVRRDALTRVGGFRTLRQPFREDTDLGLRLVEQVGPIEFAPDAVVRHPIDDVSLRRHLRTALFFAEDAAFFAAHPGHAPSVLGEPLARVRIRLACGSVAAAAAALHPRLRRASAGALGTIALLLSLQVDHDLRRAGISAHPARRLAAVVLRLPRSLAWALTAGAARIWGVYGVRVRSHRVGPPTLEKFQAR